MANSDACKKFRESLRVPPSKLNKSSNSNTKKNTNAGSDHGERGGEGRTRGGFTR